MDEDSRSRVVRDRKPGEGFLYAECQRCGMGWLEHDEPTELLPGAWTGSGPRDHECPEPYSREVAEVYVQMARATRGMVVSQTMKARIKLGLEAEAA